MGYISKRKLKKEYNKLVASAELLLFSSKASTTLFKSTISELKNENKLLRERMERIDFDKKIDWEALDKEFMESARGRHRKPSVDTSRW